MLRDAIMQWLECEDNIMRTTGLWSILQLCNSNSGVFIAVIDYFVSMIFIPVASQIYTYVYVR